MANQRRELREWSASRPIRRREDELPLPNSSLWLGTQVPRLRCSAAEKRKDALKHRRILPLDLGVFK